MPAFTYTALTASGGTTHGRVEADDAIAAQRAVEALGLIPSAVTMADGGSWRGARVPAQEVLAFARGLGGLLQAGVPLSRALTVIEKETSHPAARAAWSAIHAQVRDGSGLAVAMAAQNGLFPQVFVAMVQAGETGGFLAVVLEQVADYMERARELTSRVVSALIYPALLGVVSTGVVVFLLMWFIPRFATLFASFKAELPPLTQLIQAASVALVEWGWLIALLIIGAVFALRSWIRTPGGARWWNRQLLKTPGIAPVLSTLARVRFCRMLGTLLSAGVPLMNAMSVARATAGNAVLVDALHQASERVRQGESLTAALSAQHDLGAMLPPTAREGLAVAEGAGRLPAALLRLADASEKELDRRLRTAVSIVEPLLLLVMASVVGTIVVGMLLPIFRLWSAVK